MRYERVPYDTLYTIIIIIIRNFSFFSRGSNRFQQENSKKIVNPKHSNQNASIIRETDFYIKKLLNEGKPQQPQLILCQQ